MIYKNSAPCRRLNAFPENKIVKKRDKGLQQNPALEYSFHIAPLIEFIVFNWLFVKIQARFKIRWSFSCDELNLQR
jgi:hypothetical protein